MTSQELRSVVEKAVAAIEAVGNAEAAKLEAKEKVAKSCLLTVDTAWAYINEMNEPTTYRKVTLEISDHGYGPIVEWLYYDEKIGHLKAPELKLLLQSLKTAKELFCAKPQTLDDAVAALDCPPLPALTETLAGPF